MSNNIIDIALCIISIALIFVVILQNKSAGLGGLTGAESGTVFTARRGIDKTLFWVTIAFSVVFFLLAVASLVINR